MYSRSPTVDDQVLATASDIIKKAGLEPNKFCTIRNGCFSNKNKDCIPQSQTTSINSRKFSSNINNIFNLNSQTINNEYHLCNADTTMADTEANLSKDAPFWYIGQRFFQVTNGIGKELSDWFEDPAILSEWLLSQQQHGLLNTPLVSLHYTGFMDFLLI